ncbi:hypothetical protein C0J52_01563 [Blattella germanica]|nr:hypothetical protein C0J52_01563 [Blattella germanica]
MFPDPMLCDHFNPQDKRYIRECPQTYPGCLTYKNGSRVLRMCSQQKEINDCKRANNVQYCLCSGDLCNGNASKQAPPDDEDQELPEGSGAGAGAANRDEHRPTTGSPPHGTTTEEPPHSCATSLLPALITIATSSIICVT